MWNIYIKSECFYLFYMLRFIPLILVFFHLFHFFTFWHFQWSWWKTFRKARKLLTEYSSKIKTDCFLHFSLVFQFSKSWVIFCDFGIIFWYFNAYNKRKKWKSYRALITHKILSRKQLELHGLFEALNFNNFPKTW